MTEFEDYKVEVTLHDNTKLDGLISNIEALSRTLTLTDAKFHSSNEIMPVFKVDGSKINDLKVIKLPADFYKQGKQAKKLKPKKTEKPEKIKQITVEPPLAPHPQQLLDDAIIFASTKKPNAVPQRETAISRPDTPKAAKKTPKSTQQAPQSAKSYTDDPDWDTDDISEIKKSNDFDFQSNLALFDKSNVFAKLKESDSVAPSNRLVGHNRLESPGPRKTKYDNDEMILSNNNDNWDVVVNNSNTVPHRESIDNDPRKLSINPSASLHQLKLNEETIPLCSPVNLLEIERLCSEWGMNSTIIIENSSRGIAQIVLQVLGGSSRFNFKNHNVPPLVLLLVGNNRSGSIALATGRHLTNHGIRTLGFLLNDNKEELDEDVSKQLDIFTKSGGKTVSSMSQLKTILNQLNSPLELILDGLQGFDTSLSDLWGNELECAKSVIQWANSQKAGIMSLHMPSGIDCGSGQIIDAELYVEDSKWIISLGLPLNGIVHSYNSGILAGDLIHYLVDVGLPNSLFKSKSSLRKFDKQWFKSDFFSLLEVATVN